MAVVWKQQSWFGLIQCSWGSLLSFLDCREGKKSNPSAVCPLCITILLLFVMSNTSNHCKKMTTWNNHNSILMPLCTLPCRRDHGNTQQLWFPNFFHNILSLIWWVQIIFSVNVTGSGSWPMLYSMSFAHTQMWETSEYWWSLHKHWELPILEISVNLHRVEKCPKKKDCRDFRFDSASVNRKWGNPRGKKKITRSSLNKSDSQTHVQRPSTATYTIATSYIPLTSSVPSSVWRSISYIN